MIETLRQIGLCLAMFAIIWQGILYIKNEDNWQDTMDRVLGMVVYALEVWMLWAIVVSS